MRNPFTQNVIASISASHRMISSHAANALAFHTPRCGPGRYLAAPFTLSTATGNWLQQVAWDIVTENAALCGLDSDYQSAEYELSNPTPNTLRVNDAQGGVTEYQLRRDGGAPVTVQYAGAGQEITGLVPGSYEMKAGTAPWSAPAIVRGAVAGGVQVVARNTYYSSSTAGVTATVPDGGADGDMILWVGFSKNYLENNLLTSDFRTDYPSGNRSFLNVLGSTSGFATSRSVLRDYMPWSAGMVKSYPTTLRDHGIISCLILRGAATPAAVSAPLMRLDRGINFSLPAANAAADGALVINMAMMFQSTPPEWRSGGIGPTYTLGDLSPQAVFDAPVDIEEYVRGVSTSSGYLVHYQGAQTVFAGAVPETEVPTPGFWNAQASSWRFVVDPA